MSAPPPLLSVMVVDDDRLIRMLLRRFVESLGHTVHEAGSGEEALALFETLIPDLVLMDMVMPGMDGLATAREIKLRAGKHWIPVIFLTALDNEADLVTALSQGGDDYLTKPVNFPILRAKITAFGRSAELNKRVRQQAEELSQYQDRTMEEQRVAQHLMERIIVSSNLKDPMLATWLSPADMLSGDLLAAARTPGDVLYVMLADGVGHGLTAALNVLPVTQPFYSMAEKGFSISEIAREINSKVQQILPRDRFIATAIVAVDLVTARIEVWNGGIPKIHLLDNQGKVAHIFASKHLPLGILSAAKFDSRVESFMINQPYRLAMFSDGLPEAENHEKTQFGLESIISALGEFGAQDEIDRIKSSVESHLNGLAHHDDISVAVVYCDTSLIEQSTTNILSQVESAEDQQDEKSWHFNLQVGPAELKTVNVVPLLIHILDQFGVSRRQRSEIFLILTELYTNALDHGLLQLDSNLKHASNGMDDYFQLRSERLDAFRNGHITIDLSVDYEQGYPLLRMQLSDTGPGFLAHPAEDLHETLIASKPSGKGIALVKTLCLSLDYNDQGNQVIALYSLRNARPGRTGG